MKVMNNKKGFTLIELLVVVAIIGILSAVGVVAYNGYTSGAKKSACKANHKTMVKTVYENVMWCEINPTIDIAWSSQFIETHTCGNISAAHRKRGRTQEEQLAWLSMNEIAATDRLRNWAETQGFETKIGDRSTLNMLNNPYDPQGNVPIFYINNMLGKAPDEIDLIDTSGYMNPFQDGHLVLVKLGEDGKAKPQSEEGDLMLYSNCGGELQEHKFEIN